MTYESPPPLTFVADRLAGRVIMVTGASSGIGEAAVRRFAAEGAKVIAAARRVDRLDRIVEAVLNSGGEATAVACDVTDEASIEGAVAAGVEVFGRLDGAFDNAGVPGPRRPMHQVESSAFDRVIATNLRGAFLSLKYQVPHLLIAGGGSIVFTSSSVGLVGGPRNGAYAASKWALAGLVKSAALDYASSGIRINAIAPGPTWSEIFDRYTPTPEELEGLAASSPMNYIAAADDIARAALYLLSDEARWTTGCVLPCEGGFTAG